jgi:hypothetical protein
MKITLGGRYRIDELGDAFDRVLQNFRANGVEEIQLCPSTSTSISKNGRWHWLTIAENALNISNSMVRPSANSDPLLIASARYRASVMHNEGGDLSNHGSDQPYCAGVGAGSNAQ